MIVKSNKAPEKGEKSVIMRDGHRRFGRASDFHAGTLGDVRSGASFTPKSCLI